MENITTDFITANNAYGLVGNCRALTSRLCCLMAWDDPANGQHEGDFKPPGARWKRERRGPTISTQPSWLTFLFCFSPCILHYLIPLPWNSLPYLSSSSSSNVKIPHNPHTLLISENSSPSLYSHLVPFLNLPPNTFHVQTHTHINSTRPILHSLSLPFPSISLVSSPSPKYSSLYSFLYFFLLSCTCPTTLHPLAPVFSTPRLSLFLSPPHLILPPPRATRRELSYRNKSDIID